MSIGVEQADGDCADIFIADGFGEFGDLGFIERDQHIAVDCKAFGYCEPQMAINQWLGAFDHQIIMIKALFITLLDHVAKAFSGDESSFGTFAFDQGVGGQCGAVDENGNVLWRHFRFFEDELDAFQHAKLWRLDGGQDFSTPTF